MGIFQAIIWIAVLFAVICKISTTKLRFDRYKVYHLIPKNEEALETLRSLEDIPGFDFWKEATKVGVTADLMVPPDYDISNLLNQGNIESSILVENVQNLIDAESISRRDTDGSRAMEWSSYHTYEEISAWLEELAEQYPNNITLLNAGKTFEGRDLIGVKLSFSEANANRSIFIESNIHAREWITSAVSTYIINELLTSTNSSVRSLAEKHDWYIFPIFNPDGFAYSHTTDRMWRKTRYPHSVFCFGADPNRNWDYLWMNGGSSRNPCTEGYAGPTPFSELSVKNMADYISTVADKLVAYISFHSYKQLLLTPYGNTTDHLDNYNETKEIGEISMRALAARYGTEYVIGNFAEALYVGTGISIDWVKGVHRVPLAYLYELRDTGTYGFLLPADQIIPTGEETLDSLVAMFEEYERRYPEKYL